MTDLILHHYPQSPVAQKIRFSLGIAAANWHSVEIPRLPPKPLLMPLTANYRRVPVLQIGADIHCDSQNIIRAMASVGHAEALFPDGCVGQAMALAGWVETAMFNLAVQIVITSAIDTAPPEFIADRKGLYFEPNWTEARMKAALPAAILQLQAHLAWTDDMLSATGFAIGSALSYADAAIAYIAWFLKGRWEDGAALLAPFRHVCALEEMLVDRGSGNAVEMTAQAALAVARTHNPVSPTGVNVGFDAGFQVGQQVMLHQRGTTADPDIFGSLRYLDDTRVSIDHDSPQTLSVAVHFPVAGYVLSAV